jgi:hypothetical protein
MASGSTNAIRNFEHYFVGLHRNMVIDGKLFLFLIFFRMLTLDRAFRQSFLRNMAQTNMAALPGVGADSGTGSTSIWI